MRPVSFLISALMLPALGFGQASTPPVSRWVYKPYLLNGEPVEVDTTINVIFSLGR